MAPDHPVPAQVDPVRIQQVLLNLLSNAFKFTPPDGTVRLELRDGARDGTAHVEVGDSGPGIAPDRRGEVFERFHQLDGSSTRKMGGTGLGLHIARELVDLHGGTSGWATRPRAARSSSSDLPVVAPAGTRGDPASPSPSEPPAAVLLDRARRDRPRRRRAGRAGPTRRPDGAPLVLVVEDNPDMNRFVCEALAGSFRVHAALDGKEGFALARSLRPDLIICDFMMPEMSGDELVRAVRAEPRIDATPILILTARNDPRPASTSCARAPTTTC